MLILLVVLLLFCFGGLPCWPYSRSWSYYPSGLTLIFVLIVLFLLLGNY